MRPPENQHSPRDIKLVFPSCHLNFFSSGTFTRPSNLLAMVVRTGFEPVINEKDCFRSTLSFDFTPIRELFN